MAWFGDLANWAVVLRHGRAPDRCRDMIAVAWILVRKCADPWDNRRIFWYEGMRIGAWQPSVFTGEIITQSIPASSIIIPEYS